MRNPFRILFLLLVLANITSCSPKALQSKEAAFSRIVPLSEMNTRLKFMALDSSEKPYKIGSSIELALENTSSNRVIFPSDYGIKIFTYQNGKWISINNLTKYIPEGNTQVSPKGPDNPGIIGVGFFPDLSNDGRPIELRVVVIGDVYEGENPTGEKASAYIDITLQP